MSAARTVCLSLELEFDDKRVAGRLEDEQGNDWRFSSWLDLLTLIEHMPRTRSGLAYCDRASVRAPVRNSRQT